ncbi:MAG: hypothetical protein HYX79_04925 [Chloroflexi bacterium]|nr:hypothetical protein [Chloroflexota bacterium]
MDEIGNIALAENRLHGQLREVFPHIRKAGQVEPRDLYLSLEILESLRNLVAEDMNQLPHEGLILRTVKLLQTNFYPTTLIKWFWNPRQTGGKDEPDLKGMNMNQVIVSAEVTTSPNPKGAIDGKMSTTLKKLSDMPGDKFYVVTTEEMERRAKSKLNKLGYKINVLKV